MSFLAAYRGATGATGANITYTFPTGIIDTTALQPGQAFDLRSYLFSQGIIRSLDVTTRLNVVIPSGCTLGSSNPTRPVLTVSNFKARDRVTITNNGVIFGAGGASGGGGVSSSTNGSNGGTGGSSLVTTVPITLINNGIIKSGGGGGGGGGGYYTAYGTYICGCCDTNNCDGCPFCTGAGNPICYPSGCCSYNFCTGETTCGGTQCDNYYPSTGTGGAGGTGEGYNNSNISGSASSNGGGAGGAGGASGSAGSNGVTSTTTGGLGGLAGFSITGFSLCNIVTVGTIIGGTN